MCHDSGEPARRAPRIRRSGAGVRERETRAVSPPPGLELVDRRTLHLGDGSYHWVKVKTFRLTDPADDASVLQTLIEDPRYGDHYATDEAHTTFGLDIHGPYRRDCVTTDKFLPITRRSAKELVGGYVDRYEIPAETRPILERFVVQPIGESTSLYELPDLGKEAHHDWGWVLDDFRELVILQRDSETLRLVVLAGD